MSKIKYQNTNNNKESSDFKRLFSAICEIKDFLSTLNVKDLKNYKMIFYNQKFPKWRLDMLWEFINDDLEYKWVEKVFKDKNII